MIRITKSPPQQRGFSLAEILMALLIASFLSLAGINFLKSTNVRLADDQQGSQLSELSALIQKRLMDDIRNVVGLNPACARNAPSTFITGACSELRVASAITPLPGLSKEDLDDLTDTLPPTNASNASSLSKPFDSARLVVYDFSGSFNCKLNPRHTSSPNPSRNVGTAVGDERLWAHPQCLPLLQVGRLYAITEEIDGIIFSNVFQITALSTLTLTDSTQNVQVDARSTDSNWNQRFGLGILGYSSAARIYPVKLIEWAISEEDGGLWRREIIPSQDNPVGRQPWALVSSNVEGLQFIYLTGSASNLITHHRQMSFTSNTANDGFEDIRAITPQVVMKSSMAVTQGGAESDNPHTADVETDSFHRKELSFFAAIFNE